MINYQKKSIKDEEIFRGLHPVTRSWFKKKFGAFSPPQKFAVPDIKSKKNTLISSPTGSGKTLSAFLTIIDELVFLSEKNMLENRTYCIYVSPLKALSNDIERNLNDPLKEIKQLMKEKYDKSLKINVGVRTGDTTSSKKSAMLKNPPHILITTPESLAIMLTTKKFKENIHKIDWCIIDEIHSLASSKRGTHLSLSLERLNMITDFTRIGLSATVAPLDDVAKFLIGNETDKDIDEGKTTRNCNIVDVSNIKKMDIKVVSPVDNFMDTTHEKMQTGMYKLLNNLIQEHKTTLVFTNTRAATERVVHNLKHKFPKLYGDSNTGAHHGSLSKEHRFRIESNLKEGKLKCVVSSTSLELGIDIGSIDLVVLLGSPKSVARALQRIGRSGHGLDQVSKGRIIVLDRDDLVECGVLLKSAIDKKIDRIDIPKNPLDVLVQQVYGMSINDKMHIDDMYNIVRRSYSFQTLEKYDFLEVVKYLAGDYAELENRNVYAKIWHDEKTGMIGSRSKMARLIYMTNIGTIPDTSGIVVKIGDHPIGIIDESFLERLKKGDVFVLGGSTYIFKYARGMTIQVESSLGLPPTVPSWVSEMLPLSFDLAVEIQKFRKYVQDYLKKEYSSDKQRENDTINFIDDYLYVDKNGAKAIYQYFKEQFLYAVIPHYKRLLIEHYDDGRKKYVLFHSLYGRRVNDVLSRAIAFAVSKENKKDVEIGLSDNGFYLSSSAKMQIIQAIKNIDSNDLENIMSLVLDYSEVLKRRFRHCASRALMILRNYKGSKRSVSRQQMSSHMLINAVKRINPNFSILREAKREVLEDLMDIEHAKEVLFHIENKNIKISQINTSIPTPFAFNLVMQGYSDILKMEDRIDFLRRMHSSVLAKIGLKQGKEMKNKYQNIDNNKSNDEKNISKIKDDLLLESMIKEPMSFEQKLMIEQTSYIDVTPKMKILINDLIRGMDLEEIGHNFFDWIQKYQNEITKRWPRKLAKFVLAKKSEFFNENFDYTSYWDEKEEEKNEKEQEEIAKLRFDFDKASKKIGLSANLRFEGFSVIDGDTDSMSREFKLWLDELLKGTVPKIWSTRLVKFLMKVKED